MPAKAFSLQKLRSLFGEWLPKPIFSVVWKRGSLAEKLQQMIMERIGFRHVTRVPGIFEYYFFNS